MYKRKPTVLIARQAYSNYESVGDASSCGPGQKWDPNFAYGSLPPGQCVPASQALTPAPSDQASGGSGVLASIGTFIGGLIKGGTSSTAPAPGYPMQPVSSTPTWLMPVAIGGVALVAVLLITKKPRQNPARGRRRRHRRSRR